MLIPDIRDAHLNISKSCEGHVQEHLSQHHL